MSLNPLDIVNLHADFHLPWYPIFINYCQRKKQYLQQSCWLADKKKEYAFKHVACSFRLKRYFWLKIKFAILAKVILGCNERQRLQKDAGVLIPLTDIAV